MGLEVVGGYQEWGCHLVAAMHRQMGDQPPMGQKKKNPWDHSGPNRRVKKKDLNAV